MNKTPIQYDILWEPLLRVSFAYILRCCFCTLILVTLISCSSLGTQGTVGSATVTVEVSNVDCAAASIPTAVPAIMTALVAGTPSRRTAPSYCEIRQTALCIAARQPTQVPDSVDKDMRPSKEIIDYSLYLKGMRVASWQGWIDNEEPAEITIPEHKFFVTVFMAVPNQVEAKVVCEGRVTLRDSTEEQVIRLRQWRASHPAVSWHKVQISGSIAGVTEWGEVVLYDSEIEPIE